MITKTCLGFSTTIVIAITIAELEILSRSVVQLRTMLFLNLIAGVSGLIVFLCAWALKASHRKTSPENESKDKPNSDFHPLHFLCEFTYWGLVVAIVTTFSCVVIVGSSLMQPKVKAKARIASSPASVPVKFPEMRLQGIVLRESQSSVMIDGKIYFLGDYIGAIRVVAIDGESATLELSGQTNVLVLPK